MLAGLAVALGLLAVAPAWSQVIPGSADPLRVQERPRPAPKRPTDGPLLEIEEPPQVVPEGFDAIPLTVRRIEIEGATVYGSDEFAPLWRELLDRPTTLAEVYGVAVAITAKYRNDGYVLSRAFVPAQEIENGVVRLEVIEGYIGKVTIEGEIGGERIPRGYADKITSLRPLNIKDLERYLLLLSDLPGVTVSSVLGPLPGETGASQLTIEMTQKLVDVFGTFDNRGSRYIGPYQASAGGRINSVLGGNEVTQLRAITTPLHLKELRAYDLSHKVPIDTEGTTLSLGINQAWSRPGFTLQPLGLNSTATVTSTSLNHPLLRTRAENVSISAGFVASDLHTTALNGAANFLNDRIRTFQFGGIYDFIDNWDGVNVFDLQLSQGADILSARTSGSPNLSRVNGRSDFTKVIGDAQRVQSLGGNWSLLFAATGQYAFTSLLASEQFGIGGVNFVRAYDPAELTGDSGIAGKLELQYSERLEGGWLGNYQIYAYYDAGRVWNRQPQAAENPSASATAAGVGFRFTLWDAITGSVEVAKPLTRDVATEGNKEPRVFFGLVARF